MGKGLVERFGGEVPRDLDQLVTLPGVARKTANVVLGTAYGIPSGFVVDTHVKRVAWRLGLTDEIEPEAIEQDLMGLFSRDDWIFLGHALIWHGRRVCHAHDPDCDAVRARAGLPQTGSRALKVAARDRGRRRALCSRAPARGVLDDACPDPAGHEDAILGGEVLIKLTDFPGSAAKEGCVLGYIPAPPDAGDGGAASRRRLRPVHAAGAEVGGRPRRRRRVLNRQELDLPWPIGDRHFTVRLVEERSKDGGYRFEFDYVKGSGNVEDTRGHWSIEPWKDGSRVTYVLWSDPGGVVPMWAVNRASRRTLPEVVVALRDRVRDRRRRARRPAPTATHGRMAGRAACLATPSLSRDRDSSSRRRVGAEPPDLGFPQHPPELRERLAAALAGARAGLRRAQRAPSARRQSACSPIGCCSRARPISSSTRTTRWTGIRGAPRRWPRRRARTSRSSSRSATRPATGVTSWSGRASTTSASPRSSARASSRSRSIARSARTSTTST